MNRFNKHGECVSGSVDALTNAFNDMRNSKPIWWQVPQAAFVGNRERLHAYQAIVSQFIPRLMAAEIRCEFIACPVTDTTNIVVPSAFMTGWTEVFKLVGFEEREIPNPAMDPQEKQELMEALMRGGEFKDGHR